MGIEEIAQAFIDEYYALLDIGDPSSRSRLAPLYRSDSQLTWGIASYRGTDAIIKFLQSVPNMNHVPDPPKVTIIPETGSIFVEVTGKLQLGRQDESAYTEKFLLVSKGQGDLYNM
ncbi:hypothetical protein DL93DRAFT_2159603 [Clavulina sp. PMI_390]|nr:hypothetical protein DL93DRAFT_2159603 [Clavulina sp. PMI_390]